MTSPADAEPAGGSKATGEQKNQQNQQKESAQAADGDVLQHRRNNKHDYNEANQSDSHVSPSTQTVVFLDTSMA